MFSGFKALKLVVFSLLFLAVAVEPARGALWDNKKDDLSLPATTVEERRDKRKIGGSDFEFIFYSSELKPEQISEFYRTLLVRLGWKESQILKDFGKKDLPEGAPDLQALPQLSKFQTGQVNKMLCSNLIFENGEETLIVIFLPGGYPGDRGKTGYSISRGKKIGLNAMRSGEEGFVPESMSRPKKDVYAVYPGATLVSFSEDEHSLRAAYFTKDEIENAAEFYKQKMAGYNWVLNNERPISKVDKGASEDCPSCKAAASLAGVSVENWSTQLDFIGKTGDKCNVMITQVVPQEKGFQSLRMTTITVNYEQSAR